MMWRITAFDKEGRELGHVELEQGELTIGRDGDRQLVLPSASVSRRHARVVIQNGSPCIVDEGSSNGVLVNGVRIVQPTAVGPTTRIDLAEFRLSVESAMPTSGVAPLPPVIPMVAQRTSAPAEGGVRLVAEGGPYDGRVANIPQGVSHVGRATDNDHVFDDPSLSRRHARIHRIGDQLEVEDLGSSNGTFVNGRRINRQAVAAGDIVRFGDLNFRAEGGSHGSTRAVEPGIPRIQLYTLAGGGALTLIILILTIVFLVRKVPPVQASGKEAIAKLQLRADAHLSQGKALYREKKYADAKNELTAALEIDPANVDARKLRALAASGAEDDRALSVAGAAMAVGDRKGYESALRSFAQMSEGSQARTQLAAKLVPALTRFGQQRCERASWPDCAWALCRAFEIAPPDNKPDRSASRILGDAERKLRRDRTFTPCKAD